MTVRKVIPIRDWPDRDRDAWNTAIASGDLLDDAGPAAHWSEGTRRTVASGYGRWTGFILKHHPETIDASPADRATSDRIEAFITLLRTQVTPSGVADYVRQTYDALRVMAPDRDWTWLRGVKARLEALRTPKPKRHKMVDADRIFDLGLRLMDEARDRIAATGDRKVPGANPYTEVIRYRDGLIIALLAARPLRRRNITDFHLDRNLVRVGDGYALVFGPDEMKNHQPFEAPLPDRLVPYMDHYLDVIRLRFSGADTHDGVWPSIRKRPMGSQAIYQMVGDRTKAAFGQAINLHLFRDCLATTIANRDPVHVMAARDLLGHSTLAMTERHYNQAQTLDAARRYQATLMAARDDLCRSTRPNKRRPPCAP